MNFRKPSRLKRAWWYITDDFPWWKVSAVYLLALALFALWQSMFGDYRPVRAFKGDDTCYVDWNGRSNPIVCD